MQFQLNGLGPTQGASRIRLVAAGAMLLFAAAGALASDLAAPELVLARSGHDGAIMQAGQFEAATLDQHDRSQGAQLTQVGSNNQLHVLQSGQGNTVTAQQHGADNSAAILQSGGYGVVDLEQRGTGNSATLSQGGLGSTARVEQFGDGNRAELSQAAGPLHAAVRQYGDRTAAILIQY
jgi:minor curlin subunit